MKGVARLCALVFDEKMGRFRVDPSEKLVLLVMTQRMPADLEIQVKVKTLVYQALVDE